MSISISGSNAMSGLSGMDTNFDTVLTKLKSVESTQIRRLEAWKSDWKLRYEAFGKIIEQVQAASSMLSTLGDRNSFVTKNTASSAQNIVTAVASAAAQDVQHSIHVQQMASNAIWANTGHVFDAKTDLINTTDSPQTFEFSYAGKKHSMVVPAKTTLDSFASMVNNSVDNPGIKVSLVRTGSGYVFQVAGKSTGAANDLIIHSSSLVGMDAAGSTSVWQSNAALDMGQALTNPTRFAYDLLMEDGNRFSVSVTGDKTNADLVTQINAQVGRSIASLDGSGNLTLADVKAAYRRDSVAQPTFSTASATFTVGSDPGNTLLSGPLTVTLNMNNGVTSGTRTLTIEAGVSVRDALMRIAQASGSPSAEMTLNGSGSWNMSLANVEGVSLNFADSASDAAKMSFGLTPASLGEKVVGQGGAQSFTASTGLTFAADKLASTLSADAGGRYVYTVVRSDGSTVLVDELAASDGGGPITGAATYQQLAEAIAAKMGVAAGTDADGNRTVLLDNVESFYLSAGTGGGMDGVRAKTEASASITGMAAADTLETPPQLNYRIVGNDGVPVEFSLPGGSTMAAVLTEMKNRGLSIGLLGADGAAVDISGGIPAAGQYTLTVDNVGAVSGPGITGQVASSSNWNIQRAANARFLVDNWPMVMESESNSVSDAVEGVVFSIHDVGKASISVTTDVASVEKSIQNFLDAVNSVILTIREYTKYDSAKEVTTFDPSKMGSDNYSPSQLTSEKGGLLQGNYGVQLFKSRFSSLLNSSPPGFLSRQSAGDILSGDLLANLANLGIKTNTEEKSDHYGLLEIAPSSSIEALRQMDQENYSNMINKNLEAVVDFFCSSGTGASTSSDFRYGSHVPGITKGGSYDVSYTVDGQGNITRVLVGGVEAVRDTSQPGYYYSVSSGDARGLSLQIDNLSAGEHTGQIRIKEGMVQTVNNFLKSELAFSDVNISAHSTEAQKADVFALKSRNGALMVLRENYKDIMENIDKKISREQDRLGLWESRQKKYFARLETLLKQYDSMQTQLTSQIKSLAGASSGKS